MVIKLKVQFFKSRDDKVMETYFLGFVGLIVLFLIITYAFLYGIDSSKQVKALSSELIRDRLSPLHIESLYILIYNEHILKKRSARTLLFATSTVRVVVVRKLFLFMGTTLFACDGVGWFSFCLKKSFERDAHSSHA